MEKEAKKSSIYLMHKYWGKKPSEELSSLIEEYSKRGETVLDPFSGFGGIGIEAILQNRNVILNDLNPSAVFISKSILDEKVSITKLKELFKSIKASYQAMSNEWYGYDDGVILTILRDKLNNPLKLRIKKGKNTTDVVLNEHEKSQFLNKEDEYVINDWYPTNELIVNSRISAKKGMKINDLFPKRALICQAYLYNLIDKLEDSPEKEMLKFSFTSNLANCSKLVPPIASRGDMAQGAWMTGFYVGETYLENNVFHYFENRVKKTISGKEDYLKLRNECKTNAKYKIINCDAKNLPIENSSVDFVFTDFPYGDTVPYFEQSQLWNSWLKFEVNYDEEIVVSDSSQREKNTENFENDIIKSIDEIGRVLKRGKKFVFTFHSLSGDEWNAIVKGLNKNHFKFVSCEVLIQKTLPPRQLNRAHSIKGDIVAVYEKTANNKVSPINFKTALENELTILSSKKDEFETNDLIVSIVRAMLETGFVSNIEFKDIIEQYCYIDEEKNLWRLK